MLKDLQNLPQVFPWIFATMFMKIYVRSHRVIQFILTKKAKFRLSAQVLLVWNLDRSIGQIMEKIETVLGKCAFL